VIESDSDTTYEQQPLIQALESRLTAADKVTILKIRALLLR
jgi:hypothetical protein